jgi:cephalosporin hydroxylase
VTGDEDITLRTPDARSERAAQRYLDLLKAALLDEHYLENELRIEHLLACVREREEPDPGMLADPVRHMPAALRRLQHERHAGRHPSTRGRSESLAYAALGRTRLDHLESLLRTVRDEAVAGDLVDCGTGRGGAAIFMRGYLDAHELDDPRVWVADRFDRGASRTDADPTFAPDLNHVREAFAHFELLDDRVAFLQGAPAGTLADAPIGSVALLRLDLGDPEETRAVLDVMYDKVAPGGFVVIDDYAAAECRRAVDGFRSARGVEETLERIDWSAAAWRRADPVHEASPRLRAAVAAPTTDGTASNGGPAKTRDLSVVVVVHNMRREASRTLHSLSRSYQEGLDDLDYEVIVVENGSAHEQRLGEEFVRSFGEEFTYLDLGDEATPSPAQAVNRGIAASSGRAVTIMIDGAHVLTPGVLRLGMLGLSTYGPAIVTVRHWYVGPGQQPETLARGYDQESEDRLFDEIDWPTDGYRLFEIGHFIGSRDWFDGEWESNCIFVPRTLIDQVGGMDESFSMPGGGFVNLDLFERMASAPGVTLVTVLGEGSFHQVHGGTTTNLAQRDQRLDLIRGYEDHYEEVRGRRFRVPTQRAHYVGSLPAPARRTRRRRMGAEAFRAAHAQDRRPSWPAPVPEDLKTEFIDAFWRSGEWHRTPWLGQPTHRPPTDLFAYQELVARLRPDWVVETRTGSGGRALFLASVCELLDHGQVLSIDENPLDGLPEHSRITYLPGDPAAERTGVQARDIVGTPANALVILGGAGAPEIAAAFGNFAPLVPVGSYVVLEDTILDGIPVWPGFGSGPMGTTNEIVDDWEFVRDPELERYGLTFSPGGFLKRVR